MTQNPGFSKFNRQQRIEYLKDNISLTQNELLELARFSGTEESKHEPYEAMIENYIGTFPIPMGVVPNLVVNGESIMVPFVTEESSVIAAASKSAKFWAERGGFKAIVLDATKKGQIHFTWNGIPQQIKKLFPAIKVSLLESTLGLTTKMRQRGGGITAIELIDKTQELPNYYQLDLSFDTADAMGANFINSCLEQIAFTLQQNNELNNGITKVNIIMSILSNYTPDCIVRCWVECPVEKLTGWNKILSHSQFTTRFCQAIEIANHDVSRAVTHNKGIFNGIDAVLLATGNDWRATAASVHAYAARNGKYSGLTNVSVANQTFTYSMEIPMAIGTVGGITQMHPVVKNNLALLNHPNARQLMMIAAASGLASNFAAIATLITSGIQAGHMKMHLSNLLNQIEASDLEKNLAIRYFENRVISSAAVDAYISQLRDQHE